MSASLIWHMVRKDARQTWPWIIAVLISFVGLGWTSIAMMQAERDSRNLWANACSGFGAALVTAVVLFLGMLIHAEALPGERQYWLARPMNWLDMMTAKAVLGFATLIVPLGLTMGWIVEANGFEIGSHLPGLGWKVFVVAVCWGLPAAALAAVTRNLQQMSMWLVGLLLTAVFASSVVYAHGGFPRILAWFGEAGVLGIVGLLGAAILVLQYSTRRTRWSRVALSAGVLLSIAVQGLIPRGVLFGAQRRWSPVAVDAAKGSMGLDDARLFTGEGHTDQRLAKDIFLPVRLTGLAPEEIATLDSIDRVEVSAGGERMPKVSMSNSNLRRVRDQYWLQFPVELRFFERYREGAVDVRMSGQMTLYGNRRVHVMGTSEGSMDVPGVGRCAVLPEIVFAFRCVGPFQVRPMVVVSLRGADRAKAAPVLLTHPGERGPLPFSPFPLPLESLWGWLPANHDLIPNAQIEIEVSDPRSFVERSFEARGIRMADYVR